ncbi:hypothetical protein V494_01298 [Pseudogymnoascus sp. VKM F-4513 (FW-928)]|nr:hypothetical protein V494_01298 [Pseudogymnoascus sp. VKM F-4513 (FW-928)]
MSNSSGCTDTSIWSPYKFSCSLALGPRSNHTGEGELDLLKACCSSPDKVGTVDGGCRAYCNSTSREQGKQVGDCLFNYLREHRDEANGYGCDAAPPESSATMLGRTSGWAGLAMLGLLASAAATML